MTTLPGRTYPVAEANRAPTKSYYGWFLTVDAFMAAAPSPGSTVPVTRALTAGNGLTGGGDLSADRTFSVVYGTAAGTSAQGNDARIVGAAQTADLGSAAFVATSTFDAAGSAATAVASHVAAPDPHPQYLTAAEGNAVYQPVDADLTAIAALASTGIARRTGTNTWSVGTLVTYAEIQNVTNNRILGNVSGGASAPSELTGAQVASLFTAATQQVLLSGAGTYTTPANVKFLRLRLAGGGGGGAPGNALTTAATAGGNTTFSTLTANGGSPGISTGGGSGGGASGGNVNLAGGTGQNGVLLTNSPGGHGGISPFGRGGWGGSATNPGTAAKANSGSGGGGGGSAGVALAGGGGGSGGYVETIIASPAATYSYSVGAGGAGAVGTINGGAGGSGLIIIDEFYA